MNKHIKRDDLSLTRRGFVAGSAGLTFTFAFSGILSGRPEAFASATGAADKTIGGWVTITPDGKITIAAPIAEMGQGVLTALPMIVAEELDADWSKVTPFVPPQVPKLYGNPQLGGAVYVVASRTIDGFWDKARIHGAQARRVLMQAAADKWGVPLAEVITEPSVVVHKASNRRMSYGEIAGFATVPAELPAIEKADLKKPPEYRIIGKDMPRFDIPSKVNGSARYGMDAGAGDGLRDHSAFAGGRRLANMPLARGNSTRKACRTKPTATPSVRSARQPRSSLRSISPTMSITPRWSR